MNLFDTQPEINVQEPEYKRLLGYPRRHALIGRARELADWARNWYTENGKPWIYARQIEEFAIFRRRVRIDGVDFSSRKLREQLSAAQAHSAILVAVSAGFECEEKARQLWQEEKPDEYFFLEVYGSAMVEHLVTNAGAHLCAWADHHDMAVLPHYSPGYPEWDISDQRKLLELVQQEKLPDQIAVLETGMLRPKKSLLAVFGITRELSRVQNLANLIPCESCSMQSCQYRRAPYLYSRRRTEDVRQLQSRRSKFSKEERKNYSKLNQNAVYSVNSRALRKWSQERLQLKMLDDSSVEADFRYEGVTCSNLGRPLEYDYHLKLGPAGEGYKIVAMNCSPAPGDTGHTYMCEYLNNSPSLEKAIANEKPLLGRPLDEVLGWKREFSPSGCYCDSLSRMHKWGLALEVVHYALVQYEKQRIKEELAT